jgi:hypothetical protein
MSSRYVTSSIAIAAVTGLIFLVLLMPAEPGHATAMPSDSMHVIAVSGKASWRSPMTDLEWFRQQHGGREWVPVRRGDSFGRDIKLRTGARTRLALRLADGSSLKLMYDTEVELLALRDETQQGVSRVRLERGAVEVAASEPVAAQNAFLIETPTGAITVGAVAMCIRHRESQPASAPCR